MGTGEFIEKMDNEGLRCFKSGVEIAEFFRSTFPMSETEGDRLVRYMEGHGYLLGHKDGKLYRGDLCYGADDIYWETYTLYDTIEDVRDWDHEFLKEAGIDPEAAGASEQADGDRYTAGLWEDKEILDGLSARICHKEKRKNDHIMKRGMDHV